MDAIHDDVVELALLLTRLKERTDRSYAALARRLGMHASTLHRYCAGEAVPADFHGIERFAALCGASPEERVELHRRWILAVAARQRSRASEARRAPTPAAPRRAAAAVPAPHDTETAASAPTASTPHSVGTTASTASTPHGVGAAASTAYASGSGSAASARSTPDDVDTAASAPYNSPGDSAEQTPRHAAPAARQPGARRLRRWPVRSLALAASSALALVALSSSAAGRPSGDGESSASARTTPKSPVSAPHRDGGTRSAAAPPSRAPESPSPVRTTPEPSEPAPQSDGGSRETRASADADSPKVPLTWTADSQLWQRECAHDYVIAKPPGQVPPPPSPTDASVWAASQGAVHGRTTDLRISVQGRGSAAVVLEALRVRMVDRDVPAADRGIAYSTYEGCGAILVPRHFAVDLDAHRPLARSMPSNDLDRPGPAIDFPYQVSLRKPEVLLVSAQTESCTCDWYLELDWSSQGRSGTVRIDDHGRPFRTTSIEGLKQYWYRNSEGWIPMTPASEAAETSG
ncbi:helix-turn-helix domain-containing protein [Streptomyces scabiei]|uniref:transcriptional regulator n=1 Tax=Streptomyces scabiei TaxID=1930 RepID=UPI00299045B1|nr:helix-turn-helix domain-containing protein [Streptomyces scabiei]MDW8807397.1 helix-turn-helix domain-containing protein [Streptomyces scabiei]